MLVRAAELGDIPLWKAVMSELQGRGLLKKVDECVEKNNFGAGICFALPSSTLHEDFSMFTYAMQPDVYSSKSGAGGKRRVCGSTQSAVRDVSVSARCGRGS